MHRAFAYRSEQRKRQENQDSFGVFEFDGFVLAIVCDGMGGHVGGAQASALAVRTVHDQMNGVRANYGEALRNALESANQVIFETARKNHRLMGMGTTAVVAVIAEDGFVYIAHVGDSRAYLIAEGEAVQVTRDHTMVNLFVDAELLTPEDAATHPEAHVLSRSLGVERQVEVEVAAPIELAEGDILFLCSDGVHGVVNDHELGGVDWNAPASALDHVMNIVDSREGDDNATAVAVRIGTGAGMQASEVPEANTADVAAVHQGERSTIVPDDYADLYQDDTAEQAVAALEQPTEMAKSRPVTDSFIDQPTEMYGESGRIAALDDMGIVAPPQLLPEDDPSSEISVIANAAQLVEGTPIPASQHQGPYVPPEGLYQEEPEPEPRKATPPPALRAEPSSAPPPRPKGGGAGSKRKLMMVGLIGAIGLSVVALGAAFWSTRPASSRGTTMIAPTPSTPVPDTPQPVDPTPQPAEPSAPAPAQDTDVPLIDPNAGSGVFFQVQLPEAPRRLPHRALRYNQPPPRGQALFAAVQAARDKKCAESLANVRRAMEISPDYAQLYTQAWLCFKHTHVAPLSAARITKPERFKDLEHYFRGWPLPGEPELQWTDAAKKMPMWYRPALDGIEYRLEAWADSDEIDKMTKVMIDLKGEPTVADDLAADLYIEATAAAALSRVEEPSDEIIEAWARRVFVVQSALEGRVGVLLRTHRPELYPQIEAMLDQATAAEELPEDVEDALAVAKGEKPPPHKKVQKVRPKPTPKEPDLNVGPSNGGGGVIHR